jgi:hypothetical protein
MLNHPQILHDIELNKKLLAQGYITLPLLNAAEVESLKNIFYQHHANDEVNGLYVSSNHQNSATVAQISDAIQSIFKPALEQHIKDGQTVGGTFLTKAPKQTEALEPHQDWSIVDESRFRSFTIWVPLDDVNDSNGAMYVLPGSHETMRGYRHLTIPSIFGQIYEHVWKRMKPIHLKAGEAIIFDHALGHASKPNGSDKVRIAAIHSLISTNAEMRFYWNNNGTVEEFYGEKDFYNSEEAKVGPGNLKKIRDLDFEIKQLDTTEFDTLMGIDVMVNTDKMTDAHSRIPVGQSVLERIKSLFT